MSAVPELLLVLLLKYNRSSNVVVHGLYNMNFLFSLWCYLRYNRINVHLRRI